MTPSDSRRTPLRPRPPRALDDERARSYLSDWERLVKHAERGPAPYLTGCPLCDGPDGLHARDQLEALIARGGRRGRRVAHAVSLLDARFRRATLPAPHAAAHGGRWWYARF